jgi:hypothetical protein
MAASEHPRPDDEAPTGLPGDGPTGLPGDGPEEEPLGVPEARPEGEGEPERGPGAMPGVPGGGEPPSSS